MHSITLTENEMQALAGLIDAGVRATGLRCVKDAAAILEKLEAAEVVTPQADTEAQGKEETNAEG